MGAVRPCGYRVSVRATLVLALLGVVIGAAATGRAAAAGSSSVSAWGDNSGGELGDGSFNQSDSPTAVPGLVGVRSLAAGYRFNLALLSGGVVDAWGENQFGQLGTGTQAASSVPVAVKGLSGVVAVAGGGGHSLALLSNGMVMAWGYNAFGQLGDGTTTSRLTPVAIKGLSGVTAIAAGQLDSLALLSNGTVMAWGDNRDGELGNGTFGGNSSVPVLVRGLTGVTAISAGGLFNLALLGNTTVRAWGDGLVGQLGNGGTGSNVPVAVRGLSGVSAISAGDDFALALKSGAAIGWGNNNFDQLGDPAAGSQSDVPVTIPGLSHVTALAAGGISGLALLSGGTVDSWGDNAVGQLGNGTTALGATPQPVPNLSGVTAIANGANHSLALGGASPTAPLGPGISWQVASTPTPGAPSVSFAAVSAASASDAWAVGTNQHPAGNPFPVAAHWNGVSWTAISVPAPPGMAASLSGVLDLSPSDAWAVGRTTDPTTNLDRTLIEHWNGTSWSIVISPNPQSGGGANDELTAIDGVSASDIWAVGFDFASGRPLTLLFEHFNGSSWIAAPSPPSNGNDIANAVTTITSTDAWAVGTNGFATTLAAHWNGKSWAIIATPTPLNGPNPTNQLTGVTFVASNNVWASGYEANVNNTNFRQPYLLHWNGGSWQLVLAPDAGTEGSLLRGITALSATDIWAVGQTQENDGSILTLTEQFNGTIWNIVPSPDPGGVGPLVSNGLFGISSPGNRVLFSVGSQAKLGVCCTQTLALDTTNG